MTRGSKESNLFNYIFTIAKLLSLSLIPIVALSYLNMENFEPFVLEERGGYSGTIEGAAILFFAYLGFDFITCLAEEAKNPKRDLPNSIQLTIGICGIIYCLIAFSMSGMA